MTVKKKETAYGTFALAVPSLPWQRLCLYDLQSLITFVVT